MYPTRYRTMLNFIKYILGLFFPAPQKIVPVVAPPEPVVVPVQVAPEEPKTTPPGEKLYLLALSKLGTDVSPADLAKDELGCAESVSALLHEAFGDVPAGILGTYDLYNVLASHTKFERVLSEVPGDVIICVTGQGSNPDIPHGHTGICGKRWIMSNDSKSGTFVANYTFSSWWGYFKTKGRYPVHYFRRCA